MALVSADTEPREKSSRWTVLRNATSPSRHLVARKRDSEATKSNGTRKTKKQNKMKKILYSAMILSLAVAVSCKKDDETKKVESVTLDKTSATLSMLDTLTLTAVISPTDADNKIVSWSSNNIAVATVDSNGKIVPISYGTAIITVTTQDGNKFDFCTIEVNLLGQVSFKTSQTWTVGNQEWSDVVMASGCKKNTMTGYANDTYRADCRQNQGYGDLYSWVAVDTYKNQLCSDGWRVPTRQDFFNLDIAMGGTGEERQESLEFITENYLGRWGGALGGYSSTDGVLDGQGEFAFYWSQTQYDFITDFAYNLNLIIIPSGFVLIQPSYHKYNGFALRCVRDK
jgi:uncharacterized protein (TIGR02145 family)